MSFFLFLAFAACTVVFSVEGGWWYAVGAIAFAIAWICVGTLEANAKVDQMTRDAEGTDQ